MRKYTGITFTAKGNESRGRLGDLIPAAHKPVRLENRDEWVLVVTNVNSTGWTHKEVLHFLSEHPAPEGIPVMPLSDDELLQTAMKHNVLRGRPWHHDSQVSLCPIQYLTGTFKILPRTKLML